MASQIDSLGERLYRNYRITVAQPNPAANSLALMYTLDFAGYIDPDFTGPPDPQQSAAAASNAPPPPSIKAKIADQEAKEKIAKALVIQTNDPDDVASWSTTQNGLQIKFKIVKGGGGKNPNTMTLAIYNLSEDSRKRIDEESIVKLEIWYHGQSPVTLFEGDVAYVASKQQGPDLITTVTVADGYANIQNVGTIQSRTWPKGTIAKTIIVELADILGFNIGDLVGSPPKTSPVKKPFFAASSYDPDLNTSPIAESEPLLPLTAAQRAAQEADDPVLPLSSRRNESTFVTEETEARGINRVYQSAYSFAGSAKVALDDIMSSNALQYTIENRTLSVWPINGSSANLALLINSDTGLIGTPQLKKSQGGSTSQQSGGITFKTLIDPLITVGKQAKVEGESIDYASTTYEDQFFDTQRIPGGTEKFAHDCTITKVTTKGDYMGNEWFSDVEGTIS